jgi:RNA polymerase primary sigma factor
MARLIKNKPILDNSQSPNIARLLEFGKKKGFVTYDDILRFFPEAEHDMDQLEEAYNALLHAGINYTDEQAPQEEPDEEELSESIAEEEEVPPDDLANIDTDDTIGLYLKEVSRVPLLNDITEEVELAKRIE